MLFINYNIHVFKGMYAVAYDINVRDVNLNK